MSKYFSVIQQLSYVTFSIMYIEEFIVHTSLRFHIVYYSSIIPVINRNLSQCNAYSLVSLDLILFMVQVIVCVFALWVKGFLTGILSLNKPPSLSVDPPYWAEWFLIPHYFYIRFVNLSISAFPAAINSTTCLFTNYFLFSHSQPVFDLDIFSIEYILFTTPPFL